VLRPIGKSLGWVLLVLVLIQAVPWAYRFNPRTPVREVYPPTLMTDRLLQTADHERVLALTDPDRWTLFEMPQALLPPNSATVYGYYSLNGYDSLSTETYRRWANNVSGKVAAPAANGNMLTMPRPYSGREANCIYYATVGERPAMNPDAGEVTSVSGGSLLRDSGALGYVRTETSSPDPVALLSMARSGPNRIRMQIQKMAGGAVTVAEGFYPGWHAVVSGQTQRTRRTGETFTRIDVPAGTSEIDLIYIPAAVAVGGFVTLTCIALRVALLVAMALRRRRTVETSG
jgi:hypothetical protein